MAAVWKKGRIRVSPLNGLRINRGNGRWRAARRTDLCQPGGLREKEDVISTPGTTDQGRLAQGDCRLPRGIHFLELAVRDECKPSAVRRPERRDGVLGVCERPGRGAVDGADPELAASGRVGGHECQAPPVGGGRQGGGGGGGPPG